MPPVVPDLVRRRLARPALSPYSGWIVTVVVVAVAAVLRLYDLGHPAGVVFDETYYANEARSLLLYGVEHENGQPKYVVHPPLGKWAIALGIKVFGFTEFGWRIAAAVAGTLSVLLVVRIGRRLFRSDLLAGAAGLLVAMDGLHLVMSRTALLDVFLMLFVLAAFGCLVLDREHRRARWLAALENGLDPERPGRAGRPPFAVPWWRLAAAVLAGGAFAVKWSAAWYVIGFVVLIVWWEVGARRSAGVRRPWRATLRGESGWVVAFLGVAAVAYVASWTGWFLSDTGYFRHWQRDYNGVADDNVIGALTNLWHYHYEALKFHTGLASHHPYQSWPWQWLLLGRPVVFYRNAAVSCGAPACNSEIVLLGTPLLWWSFAPALAALAWLGISRRDWRAGALGLGVAVGILPWFWYALDGRTMFAFYALPAEPFLALAVAYVLGAIIGPAPSGPAGERRRLIGATVAGAYVVLVIICFAYFYPIYVADALTVPQWNARMWLGRRWM
jgi:dolichyl-phosphate-mannose--protein O-mannosyl transferase